MSEVSYPRAVWARVKKKSVCAHCMAGARLVGMPSANRASIEVFSLISAFRSLSKDLPVIVNLAPGIIGLGNWRATWSPVQIARWSSRRWSSEVVGKMKAPWGAGCAGATKEVMDVEPLLRFSGGDGER